MKQAKGSPKKAKLGHLAALEHYKALGPDRSLMRLHKHLAEILPPDDLVTTRTLQNWCARYHWIQAAEDHDASVAREAGELARKDAVQEAYSEITMLRRLQRKAFEKAEQLADPMSPADFKGDLVRQLGDLIDQGIRAGQRIDAMTSTGRNTIGDPEGGGAPVLAREIPDKELVDALLRRSEARGGTPGDKKRPN